MGRRERWRRAGQGRGGDNLKKGYLSATEPLSLTTSRKFGIKVLSYSATAGTQLKGNGIVISFSRIRCKLNDQGSFRLVVSGVVVVVVFNPHHTNLMSKNVLYKFYVKENLPYKFDVKTKKQTKTHTVNLM